MPTPKDNPDLLNEWEKLEKELTESGLSRFGAHREIASRYKTSCDSVYYWLTPEFRNRRGEHYKKHFREISAYKKKSYEVGNHLDSVILDVFNYNHPVSTNEISDKIKKEMGVKVSDGDIGNIIKEFERTLGANSPIIETEKDLYEINRNSPYWKVCNGYWQDLNE